MMPGHSFLPCNRDFGHIQTFLSDKEVYDFDHYVNVIGKARSNNPFTVVKMQRSMFKDIEVLSKMIIKRNMEGVSLKKAEAFIMDDSHKDSFGILKMYSSCKPYWVRVEEEENIRSWPSFNLSAVPLPEKYPKPVKINKEKLKDIRTLMSYIDPMYRPYFVGIIVGQKDTMNVAVSSDDSMISDMLEYVSSTQSSPCFISAHAKGLEHVFQQPVVYLNDGEYMYSSVFNITLLCS